VHQLEIKVLNIIDARCNHDVKSCISCFDLNLELLLQEFAGSIPDAVIWIVL